jgi:outer membrane protein assembly factor BamD (BamD/ComL family)
MALARMGQFFVKANAPSFANRFYGQALKTKQCQQNPVLRCDLTLAMGLDEIVMGNFNDGRKMLRQFLKDFPDAAHRDKALLGLVIADYRQGKRGDAEKTLAEMKEKYPMSDQTAAANRLLDRPR